MASRTGSLVAAVYMGCAAAGNREAGMKRNLASLAVAAMLLTFGASEASAWVCKAVGVGVSTTGRSSNIIDAKLIALRKCERRSAIPVCTLVYCR
jgi:hypothetical protein